MKGICPTCLQPIPESGESLRARMSMGRDCYQGRDGHYYLTRGGGEVSRAAINDALSKGLICPKWDDASHLEYWRAAYR